MLCPKDKRSTIDINFTMRRIALAPDLCYRYTTDEDYIKYLKHFQSHVWQQNYLWKGTTKEVYKKRFKDLYPTCILPTLGTEKTNAKEN